MISSDDGRTDPARLGPDEAAQEIKRLVAEIDRHDDLYYNQAKPEISDFEYDQLFRRLQDLEKAHPELRTPDSPTQRVGVEAVGELEKQAHEAPMLSLDSSYEMGDVRRFDERVRRELDKDAVRYLLEPKLDGASLELVYEHGVLTRAVTRGDGRTGEGVVENVRTIRSVPLRLARKHKDKELPPPPALLSVRCEAVMYLSDFEALNARRRRAKRKEYMNPRNVVSGALRQLDSRVTAQRDLTVVAFDVLAMREDDAVETDADRKGASEGRENASAAPERASDGLPFKTDREAVTALRKWGFWVPERVEVVESVEEVAAYHKGFEERRDELDYEIDGVVVKVDDLQDRERLDDTAHHPRWAIALKFAPPKAPAVVKQIDVQMGRTGEITPVARLWPVRLGGVTIRNASLHNRAYVEQLDLREGDAVWIERAGDVIPQVKQKIEPAARYVMPVSCEDCGTTLEPRGPSTFCTNHLGCPGQALQQIIHFASRRAMDIDGMGPKVAEQLVDAELVSEPADLFDLTEKQVVALDKFGDAKASKLVAAIDRARNTDLIRFLVALGIPGVGPTMARKLVLHFRDVVLDSNKAQGRQRDLFGAALGEDIFERFRNASEAEMDAIDGVGAKIASGIRDYLGRPRVQAKIDNLLDKSLSLDVPERVEVDPDVLAKYRFVLTGKLDDRDALADHLRGLGATVGSMTSKTDYLVVGDNPGSKKMQQATRQEATTVVKGIDGLNELLVSLGASQLAMEPESRSESQDDSTP